MNKYQALLTLGKYTRAMRDKNPVEEWIKFFSDVKIDKDNLEEIHRDKTGDDTEE